MDPELHRQLRRLSDRQNNLERRLQRIENSSMFRFLRWLGPKMSALGLPVPGVSQIDDAAVYQAWIQESSLREPIPPSTRQPLISVTLDSPSLKDQTYRAWEVFNSATTKPRGEAILHITGDVILEPDALANFAAAFDHDTVAVYSDWDHINSTGRRHSPRFTPEFSPELALQTPYWGSCYLTSANHDHEISWPPGAVRRIPRILWHSQQPATVAVKAHTHPASTARASIIICSRNPDRLARCLKALRPGLDQRHEIIVVAHDIDLPSIDAAKIARYHGAFHFGAMNQLGVEASNGDVLCFLNDDVLPITPDWLERMLAQAARPEVGIVGALLLYPDKTIQHAGVVVDRWHPAHIGRFQKDSALWPWLRMTRDVSAVTGACLAIRRSTWNVLGGFDPQFPVNYNDIDLCLRAAGRGFRIVIEVQAVLVHEEARTRVAVVRPEEAEKFHQRWGEITDRPDRFFNPHFSTEDETIALRLVHPAIRI